MNRWIILLATVLQALPHPFGMSPVGAFSLYAGAHGGTRSFWAWPALPLALPLLWTGFFNPTVMIGVLLGAVLAAVLGRAWLGREARGLRFAGAILSGAVAFFLVSNFTVWLGGYYPATAEGLLACYVAGLPFLGMALVADSAYTALLFTLHARLSQADRAASTVR
jgi:hypothetical protein